MREKHAVVIIKRIVVVPGHGEKERRIPLVGRLTGLRNPEDYDELEFIAWTRKRQWRHIFIPQDQIISMATFVAEFKDAGSGI